MHWGKWEIRMICEENSNKEMKAKGKEGELKKK